MTPACAYLGPNGSYTSQAARHLLPHATTFLPCSTIADVFAAQTTYAVVPLENTIHGVVQETLGCLLGEERTGWEVVRTYDKPIQHALVVPRGKQLRDIRWVASHEQALGQCASFLRKNLPNAKLIPVPSTAQAAHIVHSLSLHHVQHNGTRNTSPSPTTDVQAIPDSLRALPGAAICSLELAGQLDGLVVAREGVQDIKDNHTRFMLLRRTTNTHADDAPADPPRTSFYRIDDPSTLSNLLTDPNTTLVAIHARAFPRAPESNRRENGQCAPVLQDVQEIYMRKYNKRYLVEVAMGDGDVDVLGAVRL